jgi:hypothetical protein
MVAQQSDSVGGTPPGASPCSGDAKAATGLGNEKPASTNGEMRSAQMERAEELVDQLAERLAKFTSGFGRKILRLGARAREEAEDIWAEAQNIRRGGRG